jgi:hypothetical protein
VSADCPPDIHPLLGWLLAAAEGRFPPSDGGTTYLPPLPNGAEASVAFTGHAVICSRLTAHDLDDLDPNGFGGSHDPRVLVRMAGNGEIGVIDVTLVGHGTGNGSLPRTDRWDDHPRVHYARKLRTDVAVFGDERGLVTLAAGLAGRLEMSIETPTATHDSRVGRALIAEAVALVPAGVPVFAAVSPGNARSLRAFLSQGFTPIGSEVILHPR